MKRETGTMSQRQYGKSRGLDQSYISRLVKKGVIPTINGRIDPIAADRARAARIVPRQLRRAKCPSPETSAFLQARTAAEIYKAKTSKLDYERATGRLVDSDVVLQQLTASFGRARTRLRGLPKGMAPILAHKNPTEIEALLSEAFDDAMTPLSISSLEAAIRKAQ